MGLEAALLTSALVSTGLTAFGQFQESKEQEDISQFNAKVAEVQAETIEESKKLTTTRSRKSKETFLATQRAIFAKAGVRIDTGTPIDVLSDSATELELDILTEELNANIDKASALNDANIDSFRAQQARRQSVVRPALTILDSAQTTGPRLVNFFQDGSRGGKK